MERHAAVHALLDAGRTPAAVSRELRLDPHTLRRFARAATVEDMLHERLRRDSILDDFKAYLHQQWNSGVTDATRLTQEITELGYRGSDKTVRRHLHPLRANGRPAPPPVPTPPTVRQVTGWLTRRLKDVAEADALTLKHHHPLPALESTQEFVRDFARMLTQWSAVGECLVVEVAGHHVGPVAALDLPGSILDLPTAARLGH